MINRFFMHTAELKFRFVAVALLLAFNIGRSVLAVEITNLVTKKVVPLLETSDRSSYLVGCLWMLVYRNTEVLCTRAPGICEIKRVTKLPEISNSSKPPQQPPFQIVCVTHKIARLPSRIILLQNDKEFSVPFGVVFAFVSL
jgi:hypothetical protein